MYTNSACVFCTVSDVERIGAAMASQSDAGNANHPIGTDHLREAMRRIQLALQHLENGNQVLAYKNLKEAQQFWRDKAYEDVLTVERS